MEKNHQLQNPANSVNGTGASQSTKYPNGENSVQQNVCEHCVDVLTQLKSDLRHDIY